MKYVDGYVLPVPRKNIKAYLKMARLGKKLWRKFGALDYKECVGNHLDTGCGRPFGKAMMAKRGETIVFAYIVFKSRAHRDQVNDRVMKEMEKYSAQMKKMPFDIKRMCYAGFTANVGS